jgi:regulator of protease activity HflC (stomatin/prohibitin superfamily)
MEEGLVNGGIALIALIFWLCVFGLIIAAVAIKIVPEYRRGVAFRLGRFMGVVGPGLVFLMPFLDKIVMVDIRETRLEVPKQQYMTQDRRRVKATAAIRYRVAAPDKAILNVSNYQEALAEMAQVALIDTVADYSFDDLFLQRRDIATLLQDTLQEQARSWGLEITAVELKDLGSA